MLRSPSSEGFRLWGEYFSRLLCVPCSLRPDDLLTILKMALSINERFGFPLPLYPSYEVLTLTSVGLPPTEHIALLSFLDVPELNTLPANPLSTLRPWPHDHQCETRSQDGFAARFL